MIGRISKGEILDKGMILGDGAYSQVLKVRDRRNGKLFALKQIDLKKMTKDDKNG